MAITTQSIFPLSFVSISRGREYEVDERLITTIDKHRSEQDAHHIYSLTALTSARQWAQVNLIRQVQESRR